MGITYGPLGTVVSELFPYDGSLHGKFAGIQHGGNFGCFAQGIYIATWLGKNYGLQYVGFYLTASAVVTLFGLLLIRETRAEKLSRVQPNCTLRRRAPSRPILTRLLLCD